ncbi:MAG: hypothetical protein AAF488_18190 [Planctomycetota bacterium]
MLDELLDQIETEGVLVNADGRLPSVVTTVVGGPVRGSWWSHAKAPNVYAALRQLTEHEDVVVTKLVSGKVTFVDRRLWPELYAAGCERGAWQLGALGREDHRLLDRVDREKSCNVDAAAAARLEHVLLVHATATHDSQGLPVTRLRTWPQWREELELELEEIDAETARATFDRIVAAQNADFGGRAKLPWH